MRDITRRRDVIKGKQCVWSNGGHWRLVYLHLQQRAFLRYRCDLGVTFNINDQLTHCHSDNQHADRTTGLATGLFPRDRLC